MTRPARLEWTEAEVAHMREHYPHKPSWMVAAELGRSLRAVYGQATKMGLRKTDAFRKSDWSGGWKKGRRPAPATEFKKGHQPHNKGVKGWQAGGRADETKFKAGRKPHTWHPVGTLRMNKDGIIQKKISDTGYVPRDWKSLHSLLWEQHNGPVPKGHVVVFKDGNRANIVIENLELVSREELLARNSIHRLPDELIDLCRRLGVLNRHIHKREKKK